MNTPKVYEATYSLSQTCGKAIYLWNEQKEGKACSCLEKIWIVIKRIISGIGWVALIGIALAEAALEFTAYLITKPCNCKNTEDHFSNKIYETAFASYNAYKGAIWALLFNCNPDFYIHLNPRVVSREEV